MRQSIQKEKTCAICGETADIIWCDYVQNGVSFCVHYTIETPNEDPRESLVLCQSYPGDKEGFTQDFYTLHEALMIGSALVRAVLDKMMPPLQADQAEAKQPTPLEIFREVAGKAPINKEIFIQVLINRGSSREDAERTLGSLFRRGEVYETKFGLYKLVNLE